MVERYVFLKLTDAHATPTGRDAIRAEFERVFPGLPGVRSARIGVPADAAAAAAWDVVLVMGFAQLDDIPAYLQSPGHRAFVDTFLAGKVAARKAWNFELGVAR